MKRLFACLGLMSALLFCLPQAQAIPAFAEQTGQPCAQCHVGAFGPQLKPYGRDFKLYGYTASDGEKHLPGIALTLQTGFTHTASDQAEANAAQGYKANNNLIADQQVSAYYGGAIGKETGGFVQVTYDGTAAAWTWDNLDLRYAHSTTLAGQDAVLGLTINNSPSVQDLWNSSPTWGFPYNGSSLAAAPAAAALLDGGLGEQVLGAGAYAMWNDLIYAEADLYSPLSAGLRNHLGAGPSSGGPSDVYDGLVPYLRFALQHENETNYCQVGLLGLEAERFPGGDRSTGLRDRLRDRGVDANYAYKGSDLHYVSAHALFLREDQDLAASQILSGTQPNGWLNTLRADISYSYKNTWTPSLQWFRLQGSQDAALWGTDSGSPNSRGQVLDLAYTPLGKPESVPQWANARIALQFVRYQEFDGSTAGAADHNTLYLSFWLALSPTYALESKH